MLASFVVDTSIIAKLYFDEDGSLPVRRWMADRHHLLAPDILKIEIASVALKKLRLGQTDQPFAAKVVVEAPLLIDQFAPSDELAERGFEVATATGCSLYDSLFLTLALERGVPLVTADAKLAGRAHAADLGFTCLSPTDLAGSV